MKTEKAIFAAGCFWGVQFYFDQVPGVVKTTVGYTGGHTKNPTYEAVCAHTTGHAEAVLIEYDPDLVVGGSSVDAMQGDREKRTETYNEYDEGASELATKQRTTSSGRVGGSANKQAAAFRILLKQFFRMHDPTQLNRQGPDVGDQYRSAIFYFGDEQKKQIDKVFKEVQPNFDKPIVTQIEKAGEFYKAEEYHQKFTEKTGQGMCHIDYAPVK